MEARLATIWKSVLGVESVGVWDSFFDLGGESVAAARVFAQIQKVFKRRMEPTALLSGPTIGDLAVKLREPDRSASPWTSLVPIRAEGDRPPLFCLHAGAGTILFYYDLAQHLGSAQPLYGFQAQGLFGHTPPHTRVEEMAAHYIREMKTVQAQGPYFLAGFCFGAILAFEMAQQLRRQGEQVAFLASFDGPSPCHLDRPAPVQVERAQDQAATSRPTETHGAPPAKSLGQRILARLARQTQSLMKRRGKKKVKYAWRVVRGYFFQGRITLKYWIGTVYQRAGRPLPTTLRYGYFNWNHYNAEKRYRPSLYPGRMFIFVSEGRFFDARLGWHQWVGGGLEVREIPGEHKHHRDLMTGDFVRRVVGELDESIRQSAPQKV